MDFSLLLFLALLFRRVSSSMRCYSCEPERPSSNPDAPLCENFDYSEKFITECEYSTMCFKREVSLVLGNKLTKTVRKGCAPQSMNGEQEKVNKSWRSVKNIYEVYEQGCSENPSDDQKITKTNHCYCRGDLCNSSRELRANYFIGIMLTALCLIRIKS